VHSIKLWKINGLIFILVVVVLALTGCNRDIVDGVNRAREFKAERQYGAAIIELKSLLQKQPENGEARLLLGKVYLEIEDYASAEKEFRKARSLAVTDDDVVPLLTRALVFQKQYQQTLNLQLQDSLSPGPLAELEASQALAYLAIEQKENAKEYLKKAQQAAPQSSWIRYAQARILIADKSYTEAITVLNKLLDKDPTNGIAWSTLGKAYVIRGKLADGDHAYTQAIANRTVVSPDYLRRGTVRLMRGKLEAAAEDAEILLRRNPTWVQAGLFAGKVKFQQKRYTEAEKILESTYQLDFNNYDVVFLLAKTYFSLNKIERAETLAENAFRLRPKSMLTRNVLVQIYLRQKKGKQAEELLRPVVTAYPKDLPTRKALVVSLTQQAKYAEAEALLQQALQATPDDVDTRAALAYYYLTRDEAERVISLLQDSKEIDDSLLLLQADAYARLAQYSSAKETLELVIDRTPDSVQAYRGLARVDMALGNLHDAQASLKMSRELSRAQKIRSTTQ